MRGQEAELQRHLLRDLTAEEAFGRPAPHHATVEPVEAPQPAGDPAGALLGEHELEVRVPFEHAGEDEVPQRAVRDDRKLDQQDGAALALEQLERSASRLVTEQARKQPDAAQRKLSQFG